MKCTRGSALAPHLLPVQLLAPFCGAGPHGGVQPAGKAGGTQRAGLSLPEITSGMPPAGRFGPGWSNGSPTGDTSSLVALAGAGGDSWGVGHWKGPPKQRLTWELLKPPDPIRALWVAAQWCPHSPSWGARADSLLVLVVTMTFSLPGAGGRRKDPVSPPTCQRRGG